MTVTQRVLRCRENAQEAEMLARTASPDRRHVYKKLAGDWHTFAAELETFGRTERPLPAFPAG